jgi:hypothetical protein
MCRSFFLSGTASPLHLRTVFLRFLFALLCLGFVPAVLAQSPQLSDAPSAILLADSAPIADPAPVPEAAGYSSSAFFATPSEWIFSLDGVQAAQPDPTQTTNHGDPRPQRNPDVAVDANGNPIPLDRQQPHRILGFMPNFRTVSAGAAVHPPGWKYNFNVATHQATDYSSFIFLGLTSITAEAMNSHPALGKGADGFYAYTWRGFLDKTDGTYLSAWLLPSLLHEDTRYYPLGSGHSIFIRSLYVISRQAVAKTYNRNDTPNIAGLGGKVLTQYISRFYYPASSEGFSVLATKFGYSVMRDVGFSAIREFYPDVAAHYIRKHREKVAAQSARDTNTNTGTP